MTLNAVVLPAPFGPIRPEMWPSSTSNETPSSATMPPKRSVTSRTSRGAPSARYPKRASGNTATTGRSHRSRRDDYDRCDGSAGHRRGSRVPGRAPRLDRGEPPRGDARAPRRRRSLRRAGDARVEPRAPRRGLRGPDLAEGVRRRRRAVHAPGDLPRGDGARRGAAARRRDRPRHGRADDHGARHRGAEGALPGADPLRRGDLVPGLLRAGRGLRPRGRADERAPGEREVRRRRAEGLVVVRAPRRLLHPAHAQRPGLDAPRRAHVPDRRHARARASRCGRSADHGRGRVQRDLLHGRRGAGREPARRGRRRLAGRDDDAAARARDARLRAPGGARGAGAQARRARPRPRRRPAPARPDRARVDRDAGAPLHELPLALAAHEDRDARARRARSRSSSGRRRTSA